MVFRSIVRSDYYGMVRYDMVCDMVWYGMVWYGMVWYGMVWHGMVCPPVLVSRFWGLEAPRLMATDLLSSLFSRGWIYVALVPITRLVRRNLAFLSIVTALFCSFVPIMLACVSFAYLG